MSRGGTLFLVLGQAGPPLIHLAAVADEEVPLMSLGHVVTPGCPVPEQQVTQVTLVGRLAAASQVVRQVLFGPKLFAAAETLEGFGFGMPAVDVALQQLGAGEQLPTASHRTQHRPAGPVLQASVSGQCRATRQRQPAHLTHFSARLFHFSPSADCRKL